MDFVGFLLWRLLVVGAGPLGSALMSTGTQELLGAFTQFHDVEPPSFGVGFDLAAPYGTAAISFPNGTITTIAKIPTEDGYKEVLQRLSLDSSRHLSPPYQNLGDEWKDAPRQAARRVRKAMGLPASQDVGYLANMLIALRSAVEEHLHITISSAGVTTMNLAALYQEDLRDATEYAKLEYLAFPVRYQILYETSAAYAGYGYGLCADYTKRALCKEEQDDMDSEVVMAVLFTRTVLTVSLSVMKSAYYLYEPDTRHFSDFDLGYDSQTRQQSEQDYWDAVGSRLKEIMVKNPYFKRPAQVLLMGDCIDAGRFRCTLREALSSQMDPMPSIVSRDAEFAAAKGAAELTKRLSWDPYKS
ncbi:MAG: hypothetical protein LQ338_002162 [Usnochroma carphineum]|nr:MAG: hypothetical protein LQ338_002162 [Usnochroma carphineum]